MRGNKDAQLKREVESLRSIISQCDTDIKDVRAALFKGEGDAVWVRDMKKRAIELAKRRSHYILLLEKKTQLAFDFPNR